ncbi:MAG: hypothetical protein QM608_03300 [Caulobacter sp.]
MRISWIGNSCPVDGEGWIAGETFHFRARGNSWRLSIGDYPETLWEHAGLYRPGVDFAASYMPYDVAETLIRDAAAMFIEERVGPHVSMREQEMWRFLPDTRYGPFDHVRLDWQQTGAAGYLAQADGRRVRLRMTREKDEFGMDVERWEVFGLFWRYDLHIPVLCELESAAARAGLSGRTVVDYKRADY